MSNRDHVFVLGFDDSEAIKGLEKFEKRLSKVGSNFSVTGTRTNTRRGAAAANPSLNLDSQLRLERALDRYKAKLEATWGAGTAKAKEYTDQVRKMKLETQKATSTAQLRRINEEFKDLRQNSALAAQNLRKMNAEMGKTSFGAESFSGSMKNLAKSYLSVYTIIEGSRSLFKAGKDFDSLKAAMLAASDSAENAKANLSFVKEEAQRLGVDVIAAGNGFNKIGAAAKQAGFSVEQTKEIFSAASEASRTFGLNAERTNLVYLAFSQILSKGKVSQEELRRQLGEQLPGVMNVAAQAMNVTTGELEEMIKKGISAEDFMLKFSKRMREFVRENNALGAAVQKVEARQQRMTNAFKNFSDAIFTGGGASLLGGLFDTIASAINGVTFAVSALGTGLNAIDNFVNSVFNITVSETNAGFSFLKNTLIGLSIMLAGRYVKSVGLAVLGTNAAAAATSRWATAILFLKTAVRSLLFATGIGALFTLGGFALEKLTSSGDNTARQVSRTENNNQVVIEKVVTDDPQTLANGLKGLMTLDASTTPGAAGM